MISFLQISCGDKEDIFLIIMLFKLHKKALALCFMCMVMLLYRECHGFHLCYILFSQFMVNKQVVQECKEIYEHALVDGNPPKAGFVFTRVKCLSASRVSLWRKLT